MTAWTFRAGLAGALTVALGLPASAAALRQPAAAAPACTDSWVSAVNGSWFDASRWSAGHVPGPGDDACITTDGTYTVTQTQAGRRVDVLSLQLGGTAGTARLRVGGTCGSNANALLSTAKGAIVGAHGAVTLTGDTGCPGDTELAGPVVNAGAVTAAPGAGGERLLGGDVTNTGRIDVRSQMAFDGTQVTFENRGAVDVAAGTSLELYHVTFHNDAGGSVAAAGNGEAAVLQGTFDQGDGTTTGAVPVVVEISTLAYTGTGASVVAVRSGTVTGDIAPGQTMVVLSECCSSVIDKAAGSFTNRGTIDFADAAGLGDGATLELPSGATLTNRGTVAALAGVGRAVILGGYRQTAGGTFSPAVSSTPSRLEVTGTASLAGTLAIARASAFTPTAGSTVRVLDAGHVTGTFAHVTGAVADPARGLVFMPVYGPTAVDLRVAPG